MSSSVLYLGDRVGIGPLKIATCTSFLMILNELRMIQLQLETIRIKIGRLEPEIQPVKSWATSLGWAYDVIGQPICNIIGNIFYNLTVEVHLSDTPDISNAQLPYRRCERRNFVIYSSTRDARRLCYYLLSCKEEFFHI